MRRCGGGRPCGFAGSTEAAYLGCSVARFLLSITILSCASNALAEEGARFGPAWDGDIADLAASSRSPAEALLRVLGLDHAEPSQPDRELPNGVIARRILMPEMPVILESDYPSPQVMLREVVTQSHNGTPVHTRELDLLVRRRRGEKQPVPFAVVPVPSSVHRQEAKGDRRGTFLDLGAFRFPLSVVANPRSSWTSFKSWVASAAKDSEVVYTLGPTLGFEGWGLVAYDLTNDRYGYFQWIEGDEGGLHPFVNLSASTMTRPTELWGQTLEQLVDRRHAFVIPPTVYNPARIYDDEGFIRFVEEEVKARFRLAPTDNVVDLGSGSGYSTFRLGRATGSTPRLLAVERNPVGVLATALNLRAAGIQASVSQRWPEVDAALVLANAPKFPYLRELPQELRELPLEFTQQETAAVSAAARQQTVAGMHDGGVAGFYYWYKMMGYLGRHLTETGVSFAWNIVEGTTEAHAAELARGEHSIARMARANGLRLSVGWHENKDFYDPMGSRCARRIVGYRIERDRGAHPSGSQRAR